MNTLFLTIITKQSDSNLFVTKTQKKIRNEERLQQLTFKQGFKDSIDDESHFVSWIRRKRSEDQNLTKKLNVSEEENKELLPLKPTSLSSLFSTTWMTREKQEGNQKETEREMSHEKTQSKHWGWKESRWLSIPFVSLLNSLPIFLSLQMLFLPRAFPFSLFWNPFISFLFQGWKGANVEAQVFSFKGKMRQDCYFLFHPFFLWFKKQLIIVSTLNSPLLCLFVLFTKKRWQKNLDLFFQSFWFQL